MKNHQLTHYQHLIAEKIHANMSLLGPKTKLREACEYALTNGGKRIRPIIVLQVAEALGYNADVTHAALAIEYFHTASLVADDLPCMDDDDERRSKPSVHKTYGEAVALLVSYALIAAGYSCLERNAKSLKQSGLPFASLSDHICVLALENATFYTGLEGATGGQFLDIFPPNLHLETLREVIHKKTVSLFEISFVFGWLYGGGAIEKLPLVKQAASHFGMAFQIADDLGDMLQDCENERVVNMANVFGVEAAQQMLQKEAEGYRQTLAQLGLDTPELLQLADAFNKK